MTAKAPTKAKRPGEKSLKPAKSSARKKAVAKPATRARPSAKSPARKVPAAKPKKASASAARRPVAKPSPAFSVNKLGQVALTAKNLDDSVAFYSDVMQLRLLARFDPPGLAFFHLAAGLRLLVSATASAASLYFTVDDLDEAVRALKKRGVKFLQKPGMIYRDDAGDFGKKGVEEWMAFFNDPSGNLLALVEKR
jgi:catechol 2,3-dioxygenase-like lactoylglutathione lyase family enzyme